jgi:hypothetical protein
VGFKDSHNLSQVYSKNDFIAKFAREFSDYDDFPFLQWNVISCFDAIDLISKMTDKSIQLVYTSQVGALAYEFVSSIIGRDAQSQGNLFKTLRTFFIPKADFISQKRAQYFSYNYDSLFSIQSKKIKFDEMLKLPEIAEMKFLLPANVGSGGSASDKVLRSLRQTMLKGLLESRRKMGRTSERRSTKNIHKTAKPKPARRVAKAGSP